MPELPEVETVARRLSTVLSGKVIQGVSVLREKSFQGDPSRLTGLTIKSVARRAKIISINFHEDIKIIVHLKMTGQLIYFSKKEKIGGGHPSQDWVSKLPSSHTRIVMDLSDGAKLFFNDMRVFGWWKVVSGEGAELEFQKYGPDVNTDAFSLEYFLSKLPNRRVSIKQVVMDNKVVAGIGNIYASEALFLAKIDPTRATNSLSKKEVTRLFPFLKKVIEDGINAGGITFDGKYVDVFGFAGSYQNQLKVYGQDGENCKICKSIIEKVKLGGRGSYFCPSCQK